MLPGMSSPQQPPLPPYASNGHHPAQPSAQPAAPYQQPPAAPYQQQTATGEAVDNPLGRIAFILGLVTLGLNVVTTIAFQILIRTTGAMLGSAISSVGSLLVLAVGISALVFGLIAIRRPGPHALAGIGAGVGIAVCVSIVASFLISTVSSALYF